MHKMMILTMNNTVEVVESYKFDDSTTLYELSNKFDELVQQARKKYDCAISAVWRYFYIDDNGNKQHCFLRDLDIPAKR